METKIHYLTIAPNVRLCLGCGNRFWLDDADAPAHDYAACYEAFIEQLAAQFPPLRTIPPAP